MPCVYVDRVFHVFPFVVAGVFHGRLFVIGGQSEFRHVYSQLPSVETLDLAPLFSPSQSAETKAAWCWLDTNVELSGLPYGSAVFVLEGMNLFTLQSCVEQRFIYKGRPFKGRRNVLTHNNRDGTPVKGADPDEQDETP